MGPGAKSTIVPTFVECSETAGKKNNWWSVKSLLKTAISKTVPKSSRRPGLLFSLVHKARGGWHSPLSNPTHRLTPSPFVIHSPSYPFLNCSILPSLKIPRWSLLIFHPTTAWKFIITWPYFPCMYGRLERPECISKTNKSPPRVQDLQQPFQMLSANQSSRQLWGRRLNLKSAGISPGDGELPLWPGFTSAARERMMRTHGPTCTNIVLVETIHHAFCLFSTSAKQSMQVRRIATHQGSNWMVK